MKLAPLYILLAVVAIIGFAALNTSGSEDIVDDNVEGPKLMIKTYTAAVCEEKEDHVYCKDEFFVNCNGNVFIAGEISECNGVRVEPPSAMGAAVFDKDWVDPRK